MPCPFIVSFRFPLYLTVALFWGRVGFACGFFAQKALTYHIVVLK
jgi:hypothetical protein